MPNGDLWDGFFHPTLTLMIDHECKGGIENYVLKIADLHCKAFRVLTNDDLEGRLFLALPHRINRLSFSLTISYCIFNLQKMKGFQKFLNELRCDIT